MQYRLIRTLIVVVLCSFFNEGFTQIIHRDLIWNNYELNPEKVEGYTALQTSLWCEGCKESVKGNFRIPVLSEKISLQSGRRIEIVSIENAQVETKEGTELLPYLDQDFNIVYNTIYIKGKPFGTIAVTPIRKKGMRTEVLLSFDIVISTGPELISPGMARKKKDNVYESVLSEGDIYKISVDESGVFKIDRDFLSTHGIPYSGKKLSEFKIYGNGGAMLPEVIAEERPDDLVENALYVYDENDNNTFDANDYILWYAQGPDYINYNDTTNEYSYSQNDFEDKAYYFIKWNSGAGKRIQTIASGQGIPPDIDEILSYDYIIHHEEDDINHIHSGRMWWGDQMSGSQTEKIFNNTISGVTTGKDIKLKTVTSARSLITSNVRIGLNGQEVSAIHASVSGEFDQSYIPGPKLSQQTIEATSENINVSYVYNKPLPESIAWIDYFTLVIPRDLRVYSDQQPFYSSESMIDGYVEYRVDGLNTSSHRIWDVSNPTQPKIQQTFSETGGAGFVVAATATGPQLRYHLFNIEAPVKPDYIGKVENQNLHGLYDIEYIIVSHPDFKTQADQLADFHREHSGLTVEVIDIFQVYNEFSSGSQDITAIRDFVKMIYDRGMTSSKPLRYLLLFGDASYDYKDRLTDNTNFVPIYQSYNSYSPASSHCSDDYYAILDDNEGHWGIQSVFEGLDIGVGRLPVSTVTEATIIVNKIFDYHSSTHFGNWMQKLTFLGDDEDNNVHLFAAEEISNIVLSEYPGLNVNKVWMDAYEQVSFGSGNKYPEVNAEVDKTINQGTLIFNYIGHGGSNGMSHERVVTRPQITGWTNNTAYSFFITATCDFTQFDNPSNKSPGELMLFSPHGGAIGMVTTTRVVYIGANSDLNQDVIDSNLFEVENGKSKPLGDVYRDTRNLANINHIINKRSFMLLADPAMGLLHPRYTAKTTKINGVDIISFSDTLKALGKVTIEGEIQDNNGVLLSDFNGELWPTIYDKFGTYSTRGNDPASSATNFKMQNNIVYKGKISVNSGKFSFSFIVPKDISYNYGTGKISYYANSADEDAGGYDSTLIIGGTSDSLQEDNVAPDLKLYIDDRSWVIGGTTHYTPLLLADLHDENGINTVGSGIGREMEAILDKGTEQEKHFILNEYYEPELNSYQAGSIKYRFADLLEGKHTLHLKVWDVYNNSSEAYTEFNVVSSEEVYIANLLNYPNPFNKFTTFHFDHNKSGQNLVANLTIYTVSGKVVKSVTQDIPNAAAHSADIDWDGKDEFGDPLARGVYLYTLEIKAEDGSNEKKTQKLYIIN